MAWSRVRGSRYDAQTQTFLCFLFFLFAVLLLSAHPPRHHRANNNSYSSVVLCQPSGPLEQRTEQEVFYSCPSLSAEAFFEAVSRQLAGLEGEGSPYVGKLESQLEQTIEVAQAVQASFYKCFSLLPVSCSMFSL